MKVEWTPGDRLRRLGRGAGQQEGRHGLVRRLHLRAGRSWRSGGKVIPIVQRDEDQKFSLGVHLQTGDPAIKSLADLKGKDVSFGFAKPSTPAAT